MSKIKSYTTIMTNHKFATTELDLTYDDVLIDPVVSDISSRFGKEINPLYRERLPLVSAPMDSVCSSTFAKIASERIYVVFSHKFQTNENQIEHLKNGANGAVIGLNTTDSEILEFLKYGAKHILLDVANGANYNVRDKLIELQWVRKSANLWAGNVANAAGYNLLKQLCDYIRCGVGGGAACETSTSTGISRGAISTILDCSNNSGTENDAKIVADGGIKTNGDICKALAAGAHLVMIGKLFAACSESNAPDKIIDGNYYKQYRGMASKDVNVESNKTNFSIEGASGWIRRSGSVTEFLNNFESNLRSSMSYLNAHNLEEYYTNSKFVRITTNVMNEKKTHIY